MKIVFPFQLSLQDHNYCAAPPPSPPRSPTPPISPYHSHAHMGQLAHAQGSKEPAGGHSLLEPGDHHHHGGHGGGHGHHLGGGYHPHHSSLTPTSPAGLAQHPSVGGYPSPHYTGGPIASPRNRLVRSIIFWNPKYFIKRDKNFCLLSTSKERRRIQRKYFLSNIFC